MNETDKNYFNKHFTALHDRINTLEEKVEINISDLASNINDLATHVDERFDELAPAILVK
ncbi:MAG: hypothetical protein JWL80_443 [Parcubacteria group bacterium]|nr:hypothetical protein [Parcubacteria group bacterium]